MQRGIGENEKNKEKKTKQELCTSWNNEAYFKLQNKNKYTVLVATNYIKNDINNKNYNAYDEDKKDVKNIMTNTRNQCYK